MRSTEIPEPAPVPAPSVRALALEFTPDGARDIRVRLAEHSGDVHISLHSSDPSLAGHLRDGVHDLTGTLTRAGFDAEAWTSGQGSGHQRPHHENPRPPRLRGPNAGAEGFENLIAPPSRENQ